MALQPFATTDDLLVGWPNKTLNESESTAANELLLRATAQLSAMLARRGVEIDPEDDVQATNLKAVAVDMVRRALMASANDTLGVAQKNMTGGPYAMTWTFANPSGDMYVTKSERSLLGIGGGRAAWASMGGGDD